MNVVAVTACPTGIAHCELAADRLRRAAAERDVELTVEVRGAGGVTNELTDADVREADVAILAVDVSVSTDRFDGIPLVRCSTDDAIRDAADVLERARSSAESTSNDSAPSE